MFCRKSKYDELNEKITRAQNTAAKVERDLENQVARIDVKVESLVNKTSEKLDKISAKIAKLQMMKDVEVDYINSIDKAKIAKSKMINEAQPSKKGK